MRRVIVSTALVLTSFLSAFAQQVKVKDGVLLLDKVGIATITEEKNAAGKKVFRYFDNDKKEVFSFEPQSEKDKFWETIRMPGYEPVADMEYEALSTSFNTAKVVSELVIKRYKFYANGQWDRATIKKYIDEHPEPFLARNATQGTQVVAQTNAEVATMRIQVDDKGTIFAYGKIMGRATYEGFANGYIFRLFNAANAAKSYGSKTQSMSGDEYLFVMDADKNELKYKPDNYRLNLKANNGQVIEFIRNVVTDQALKGYWTAQDTVLVPAGMVKGNGGAFISTASNIIKQQGRVLTTEGEVFEGPVTIEFVKQQEKGITSFDFNNTVSVWYKNEKGKDKLKTFKPKDVKSFEAAGRKFETISVKGMLMSEKRFLELVYEGNQAKLFRDFGNDGSTSLVFKANDIDGAVSLGLIIKQAKVAKDILEKCPALKTFIAQNVLSDNENDGKKLVNAYCK